jgi:hypothetical protein
LQWINSQSLEEPTVSSLKELNDGIWAYLTQRNRAFEANKSTFFSKSQAGDSSSDNHKKHPSALELTHKLEDRPQRSQAISPSTLRNAGPHSGILIECNLN